MEKWIFGYEEKYSITEDGIVFSHNYNHTGQKKPLIPSIKNNYLQVKLFDGSIRNYKNIHRIVAETFLENPLNYPQVNHINENKLDNRVKNLEWCSAKYNSNYGNRNSKIRKKVLQFSKNGILITIYDSTVEAGLSNGIPHQNISACCRNEIKSAGGYRWEYENKI